jgi:hypothetical protein
MSAFGSKADISVKGLLAQKTDMPIAADECLLSVD